MTSKRRRARKRPLTAEIRPRVTSRRVTQSTVSTFHTLLKRQASLTAQLASSTESDQEAITASLVQIQASIGAQGGFHAYQQASKLGQTTERGGDSSKVLVGWLKSQKNQDKKSGAGDDVSHQEDHKIKMLEIGALSPNNYAKCSSWVRNVPMDLHSQHPDIVEQDFFKRPLPACDSEMFDVISCSLVLNYVSNAKDRGKMLSLIHSHLKPRPTSLLFLVLPLPCIQNSRYFSRSTFMELMMAIGFENIRERWRPGGKVAYWLFGRRPRASDVDWSRWRRKKLELEGTKRNNFTILLPEKHVEM